MGRVISIDGRLEVVHVKRSALGVAAENAAAANNSARDAIERAIGHAFANNRAGVIHELGRIGFEIQERTDALLTLTALAETATHCPDSIEAPGHGQAA